MDTKEISELKKTLRNMTNGGKYISNKLKTKYVENEKIFNDKELFLLLSLHPNQNFENNTSNIQYLILRKRQPFNTVSLYCKCINYDNEYCISYKICLRVLFKKFDIHKNNLKFVSVGMRAAIFSSDKRKDFLKSRSDICFHCKAKVSSSNCHIDHYQIPFVEIMNDFMSMKNMNLEDILVEEISDGDIRMSDSKLEDEWVQYHDSKVIYKISCALCNMKNGSYGYRILHKSTPLIE